jgi:hypothetical protein
MSQSSNLEQLMSALSHKRTLKILHPMSAFPPKADIVGRNSDVRFVQKQTHATQQKSLIRSVRRQAGKFGP